MLGQCQKGGLSTRGAAVNKGSRPVIFIEALKKMVIKLDHVEDLSSASSGSFYSSFQVCFRLSYCNIKAFFRSEFAVFLNIKNQDFLGENAALKIAITQLETDLKNSIKAP